MGQLMAGYIMVFLGACVVLLIVVYICLGSGTKRKTMAGIGKSMTIGTREVQEDDASVATTNAGTLLVLADGMGKAFGGRIASKLAVDTFIDLFQDYNAFDNPQYYFRKAFSAANRKILNTLEEGYGAASVTAALIQDSMLYYATVGNVRICVYRGDSIVQITEGHTVDVLARRKFVKGDLTRQKAAALLHHHRLYNFVGRDEFRDIEFFDEPIQLRKGDIVLLMSDGVYELLTEREIEKELQGSKSCQQMAYDVIECVNRAPEIDKDNASVILYRV